MGRFGLYNDSESSDEEFSQNEITFNSEIELPHPIPLSTSLPSPWGRTRFGLPSQKKMQQVQPIKCSLESMLPLEKYSVLKPREQNLPPINQYWDSSTVSICGMMEHEAKHPDIDDDIDDIVHLLQSSISSVSINQNKIQDTIDQQLKKSVDTMMSEQKKLDQWKEAYKTKKHRENKESFHALRKILKEDHEAAKTILKREKDRQVEIDAAKREEAERQAEIDAAKRKEEEERRKIEEDKEKARQKIEQDKEKAKQLAKQKHAEKYAFVDKAKGLREKLEILRKEIEPFDKEKAVSKRRMQMKRLCRGRVNTISAEVVKVQTVSKELIAALRAEKEKDDAISEQLKRGEPGIIPGMERGYDYFIDLLSSSIMVRIQAEGFNGPRGDGFPLAAFMSAVSSEIPDINPILEAHIYSVCPLAIPFVDRLGEEASEENFLESLGMIRNKEGILESFERFLQRTEGLISIMANIMSSHPSEHKLFGGHEGAIVWLNRFLDLLPNAPEQLPLFAAPVLDAFLTGAGHMLANLYEKEFAFVLNDISKDKIDRLDKGSIGAPSAHRLKKTIEVGFGGFKKVLPSKALAPLYNNGKEIPIPELMEQTTEAKGGFSQPSVGNPFGTVPTNTAQNPSNPFMSFSTGNNQMSGMNQPSAQPFGTVNSSVTQSQSQNNPFGTTNSSVTQSSTQNNPFGSSSTTSTQYQAPFNNSNPFGMQDTSNTSNGWSGETENQYGGASNSFSSTQQSFGSNSTYGTEQKKLPCKFFAQGNCKYGENCRFSHELGGDSMGVGSQNAFGFDRKPKRW